MLGLVCIRVDKYRAIALRVAACAESSVQCVALRWCACVLVCLVHGIWPCRLCCGLVIHGSALLQVAVCRSTDRSIDRIVAKRKPVFLFIITHSTQRRATSDQDELRKQGSGRPQAGGERCLRSANSPLGRRCAGESHITRDLLGFLFRSAAPPSFLLAGSGGLHYM